MPDQPHIKMPFSFGPKGSPPETCEQQSPEEIETCVENLLRYKVGFREDLPDFGVPDYSFHQMPIPMTDITEAILKYEPRAAYLISQDLSKLGEMIENIRIGFTNERN